MPSRNRPRILTGEGTQVVTVDETGRILLRDKPDLLVALAPEIDLRYERLCTDEFALIVSKSHPWWKRRAIPFSERVVKYPDARSADSSRISPVPSNCGASGCSGRSPDGAGDGASRPGR